MSYAARASNRRGGPAAAAAGDSKAAAPTLPSLSRPQLHSRKHSANSAGDVFAMPNIGQRKVSASTDKDRQQATILEQSITEEPAGKQKTSTKARAAEESTSGPSSSPAADPSSSLSPAADARSKSVYSHGRPSAKRYKTLYSKPTLLKLWSQKLTVDAVFDELYSAFETPEQQQLHLEGGAQHKYQNTRHHASGVEGERNPNHDRGPRRERDALGRLSAVANAGTSPGSASSPGLALPPSTRRTSSGSGNFGPGSLAGVFQGGVLSGVGGSGVKKSESGLPTTADFQRAPASARGRLFNERDKPAGASPSTAGWSANRWRHLQADEDSHISSSDSSTKDENEGNDMWSKPAEIGDSQWRPGHHEAIEREKQALLRGQNVQASGQRNGQDVLAQSSWRRQEPSVEPVVPGQQGNDSFNGHGASANNGAGQDGGRPQLPTSASNQSLFFDDLLGPTRQQHQPTSVHSSRSNSIVNSMSALQVGTDPSLSQSHPASSRFRTSASSTPTRASAAEGLEVLARRSPVQELSMAALQQQRPLQTPPTSAPHHFRPPPPPHPTNEPADRIFWQYRDPQGQLQGPFSVVQMQEWYGQGFFSDTLLVKRVESTDYETLGALIIRLHDVHLPFFSAPLAHHAYAAPPGMQAPGIGQPPFHRMASPTPWQQQRHSSPMPEQAQQPQQPSYDQRNASFTAGNAVYELFSKVQQPTSKSPESLISPLPEPKQPGQVATEASQRPVAPPHDPWADMTPASAQGASIPRGSSALGGQPVVAENTPLRQSAPGHHLSSIGANVLRQDSLPSPIGRSSSVSIPKDAAVKGIQPIASPAKKDTSQLPVIEGALPQFTNTGSAPVIQIKVPTPRAEAPPAPAQRTAVSNVNQATSVPAPAAKKPLTSSTPSAQVEKSASTAPSAPAPRAPQVSTAAKSDGVSVVSQENFDKQKKGSVPSLPPTEVSLASLAPSTSPPLGTPTSASRKAAPWAKSTDDKSTSGDSNLPKSASGMSLREIQAKEQKEAEARRAQEKKMHAAQRAAEEAALAERRAREASEGLPMTARWGDSAASSPSVTAPLTAAPWAKIAPTASVASKGAKKTLKEIQEEEEARRKAAQQAQVQKVSKAYANTIAHAAATPSASDSPWQTVGTPKPSTPAPASASALRPPGVNGPSSVAAASRPALQSTNSMASKPAGQAAKPSPLAAPAAVRSLSTASVTQSGISSTSNKVDEPAFPASNDLLKWCKEALKGLEIPVDDFIQMLLSFPVPLDKSTRELISDSVYASSRTLDGRYFSDAFADKRLADTKAIKLGKSVPVSLSSYFGISSSSASSNKTMADAIKFIPAQRGPENFKIVTKSKGRKK